MPNKSFGIYNSGEEVTIGDNDQLILEVGKSHIACILQQQQKKDIVGFELFTFNDHEAVNFRGLFAGVVTRSKILNKAILPAQVYINNELSLLVPVFKFSKEVASLYLDIVFGEDNLSQIQYEHVEVTPEMMNVFKISSNYYNILNSSLTNPTFQHTYSNIVRSLTIQATTLPAAFVAIRFYNTYFNVIVMKDQQFQLIQTFVYELPEDVIYHLLNIKERLQLDTEELVLQVSGMIDLNFSLYNELLKYFKNVTVENIDPNQTSLDIKDYPLHYFTPFFNLAI